MKTLPALLFLLTMAFGTIAQAAPAGQPVIELGDNTYSLTYEAPTTFNRNVDKLVEAAKKEATEFCAGKGRRPKYVSVTVDKPWVTLGIPKAVVVFRALEPGDPELADADVVAVVRKEKKKKADEAPAANAFDDLYNSLMKLDELRKKGILTDEEFQVEKQKVLQRSK